jgi:hypothetical protein
LCESVAHAVCPVCAQSALLWFLVNAACEASPCGPGLWTPVRGRLSMKRRYGGLPRMAPTGDAHHELDVVRTPGLPLLCRCCWCIVQLLSTIHVECTK